MLNILPLSADTAAILPFLPFIHHIDWFAIGCYWWFSIGCTKLINDYLQSIENILFVFFTVFFHTIFFDEWHIITWVHLFCTFCVFQNLFFAFVCNCLWSIICIYLQLFMIYYLYLFAIVYDWLFTTLCSWLQFGLQVPVSASDHLPEVGSGSTRCTYVKEQNFFSLHECKTMLKQNLFTT